MEGGKDISLLELEKRFGAFASDLEKVFDEPKVDFELTDDIANVWARYQALVAQALCKIEENGVARGHALERVQLVQKLESLERTLAHESRTRFPHNRSLMRSGALLHYLEEVMREIQDLFSALRKETS